MVHQSQQESMLQYPESPPSSLSSPLRLAEGGFGLEGLPGRGGGGGNAKRSLLPGAPGAATPLAINSQLCCCRRFQRLAAWTPSRDEWQEAGDAQRAAAVEPGARAHSPLAAGPGRSARARVSPPGRPASLGGCEGGSTASCTARDVPRTQPPGVPFHPGANRPSPNPGEKQPEHCDRFGLTL